MKRALMLSTLLLVACSGKPEDDRDLKAAFAASALKDPSSVQLRKVKANDHVICGEYNSKNSYGAYGGYEPFVFNRLIKDLWLGDSDNQYSSSAFWKDCPNAAELGLSDPLKGVTSDMNATDMNATVGADAALNAATEAAEREANAAAQARADTAANQAAEEAQKRELDQATGLAPPPHGDAYDTNNDAGE